MLPCVALHAAQAQEHAADTTPNMSVIEKYKAAEDSKHRAQEGIKSQGNILIHIEYPV